VLVDWNAIRNAKYRRSKEAEKEKREENSKLARSRNDVTAVPINTI
jgi:hypothetical protein